MRPRKVRRFLALMAFGGILAGTGIGWGVGEAKADAGADYAADHAAAICLTLDTYPTFAGITGIAQAIVEEGYLSYYDAGRAIRVAVDWVCPEHTGLINQFANTYGTQSGRYLA